MHEFVDLESPLAARRSPLADVAEAYRAVHERRATKVLLRP